jgi:hypothetical protein
MFGSLTLWFHTLPTFLQLALIFVAAPVWLTLFGVVMTVICFLSGEQPTVEGETPAQIFRHFMAFGAVCTLAFSIIFSPSLVFHYRQGMPWSDAVGLGVLAGVGLVMILVFGASLVAYYLTED